MQTYFVCAVEKCGLPILKQNPANPESWLRADGKPGGQHPGGKCIHCGTQYDMLVQLHCFKDMESADEKRAKERKATLRAEIEKDIRDEIAAEKLEIETPEVAPEPPPTIPESETEIPPVTPETPAPTEIPIPPQIEEVVPPQTNEKVSPEINEEQGVFGDD